MPKFAPAEPEPHSSKPERQPELAAAVVAVVAQEWRQLVEFAEPLAVLPPLARRALLGPLPVNPQPPLELPRRRVCLLQLFDEPLLPLVLFSGPQTISSIAPTGLLALAFVFQDSKPGCQ